MDKKQIFSACCSCDGNGGIWFVHEMMTVLFFYDLRKHRITFSRVIPCDKIMTMAPFGAVIIEKGKVYLFSNAQKESFVYDIENDFFEEIVIENIVLNAFRGVYKYGNYLYVIPYRYGRVVKISLLNQSVDYSESWNRLYGNKDGLYINSCAKISNTNVIMAVPETNMLLQYNMATDKWSTIESKNADVNYTYASYTQNNIYAFDCKNKNICIVDKGGEVSKIEKVECGSAEIIAFNDNIILDPSGNDYIYIYSKDLVKEKTYQLNYEKSQLRLDFHCLYWLVSGKYCYGINKANELLTINDENKMKTEQIKMDAQMYEDMVETIMVNNKTCFRENEMFGLEEFMIQIR